MSSRARIAKHPIHAMLVPVPIGLFIFSLVSDLVYAFGWGGVVWSDMAYYTMAGGVIGAIAAAIPGLIDYLSLSDPVTKRIATTHMILNLSVVALFLVNLWLRTTLAAGAALPLVLSIMGILALSVSGWLGGELVYVHGVGVDSSSRQDVAGDQRRRARL